MTHAPKLSLKGVESPASSQGSSKFWQAGSKQHSGEQRCVSQIVFDGKVLEPPGASMWWGQRAAGR